MRGYLIEVEIFESRGESSQLGQSSPDLIKKGIYPWMSGSYAVGQKFRYPDDVGLLCTWLVDSLTGFIRVFENGGLLPWNYLGTPYKKVIDPEGMTTECVRCSAPTASGIVVKVTRTLSSE